MKRCLKIIATLLVVCSLLLTTMPLNMMQVDAANMTKAQLMAKYPDGAYWNHTGSTNNPEGYTWSACTHHGSCGGYSGSCGCNSYKGLATQCNGYAYYLAYLVYGDDPYSNWSETTSLSSLKAGDIVRYVSGSYYHSIFVTAVNGETITFTDCNATGGCKIRWDGTTTKSTLIGKGIKYVKVAPYAWDGGTEVCNCSTSYAGEYTCTTSSADLLIRSGHGSSYASVGSIPPGATVYVSKANGSWAHVEYNGISGYASMEYLEKKTHTHSYERGYERDHPHRVYMMCSCGDYYYTGETTTMSSCSTCSNRHWVVTTWASEKGKGYPHNECPEITQGYVGNLYYVWYKLYDTNTGELYNLDRDYTATVSVYDPYGTLVNSCAYNNSAGDWIGFVPTKLGSYRMNITLSGDITANLDRYFTVACAATATFNKTSITLNLASKPTDTLTISLNGTWPDNTGIGFECDGNIVSYTRDNTVVTLTAKKAGTTDFVMKIVDKNNNNALITSATCRITVQTQSYTISYDANGGSGAPSSQIKTYGEDLTLSSTVPTRDGFVFAGWGTSADDKTTDYEAGSTYPNDTSITLYAIWKNTFYGDVNRDHTIDVDDIMLLNKIRLGNVEPTDYQRIAGDVDGNGTNDMDDVLCINKLRTGNISEFPVESLTRTFYPVTVPFDSYIYLGDTIPTTGYMLCLEYQETGAEYAIDEGYQVTVPSTTTTGRKDVKITFEDMWYIQYTTVMAPSMTINSSNVQVTKGGTYSLSYRTEPSARAITWSSSDNSVATVNNGTITAHGVGTAVITAKFVYRGITYSDTCSVTVVAPTTPLSANASYTATIATANEMVYYTFTPSTSGNYGIYSTGSEDTKVYLYDANGNELAVNDDSGEGNNFRLIHTLQAGTTYKFGVKYYSSTKTGSIPFKFGRVYTVSYNVNGGTGSISSQTAIYGETVTLTTTVLTRTGYTFLGWSTRSTATTAEYSAGTIFTATSDMTLYAVWGTAPSTDGDLNGDDQLDMRDAFALYNAVSGGNELPDAQKAAADMNGDGEIDMRDAFALYKIASGG